MRVIMRNHSQSGAIFVLDYKGLGLEVGKFHLDRRDQGLARKVRR